MPASLSWWLPFVPVETQPDDYLVGKESTGVAWSTGVLLVFFFFFSSPEPSGSQGELIGWP